MKKLSVVFALFLSVLGTSPVHADTDLANSPLVSATTGEVLPNLMYILDNSGSMGWNYMPDYVALAHKCKASNSVFSAACSYGDPAYNTSDFNTIYYNPEVTYSPGLNADGTLKTSMTSANTSAWTSVPMDAYGVQFTGNTRLVPNSTTTPTAGYPDRVWCNVNGATTAQRYDPTFCVANSQYTFPTSVFQYSSTVYGYPFYYKVSAGEYCSDKTLKTCVTASAATGLIFTQQKCVGVKMPQELIAKASTTRQQPIRMLSGLALQAYCKAVLLS